MRKRFSLLELIVGILAIGLMMGIVIPILQYSREHSRRVACAQNLSAIACAMFMYSDVPANNNYFPTTGTKDDPFNAKPMDSLGLLYNKYVMDLRCFSCPHIKWTPPNVSVWSSTQTYRYPINSTYGYDPGHRYNEGPVDFLADMPGTGENSDNHGVNAGENVATSDGTVEFRTSPVRKLKGNGTDNVYKLDTLLPRKEDAYIRQ